MTRRNHGLDLLRVFAIISVVLLHLNQSIKGFPLALAKIFNYGWSGVDLFFVLSGFLIAKQVYDEKEGVSVVKSIKTFWIKRWMRTLPLYYAALFTYAVIKPLLGFRFVNWEWKFLYFGQNYFVLDDFVQSWSLCIEEQFYLIFPLLFYIFRLKKAPAIIWLIPFSISLISRYLIYSSGALDVRSEPLIAYTIRFITHNHLDGISLGVFLAATFRYWIKFRPSTQLLYGVIGSIFIIGTLAISGHNLHGSSVIYSFSLTSIGYSMLLVALYKIRINPTLFKPIHKIALWSYGAYIWNHLIVRSFDHLPQFSWWSGSILFITVSFGVAAITYTIIEQPFLDIRKKVLRKVG